VKSKARELLDRAVAAMVAAIEIYNKPGFPYRAETFSILAINGWELLLKARWLKLHKNKERSLFIMEVRQTRTGAKGTKKYVKRTRSGNPRTYGLEYLGKKLLEQRILAPEAWKNLDALIEVRDNAVHFFNKSPEFVMRLQEIGTACVKNFAAASGEWFKRSLSEYNLFLMPLAFVDVPAAVDGVLLNSEEKNLLKYLDSLEDANAPPGNPYSVSVNVEVKFIKSKARDALAIQVTDDPKALAVRVLEESVLENYPWDYAKLTAECRKVIPNFKVSKAYHDARKKLAANANFCRIRHLDPANPNGIQKTFFHPNVLKELVKQLG
jgi:hypothetical protein